LAGGFGTRLRSVVSDRPKVLATVQGRPFVTFLLDQLVAAGVHRVVLLTGHRAEEVRACLGVSYRDLELAYSPEPAPLGTGGALRQALPQIPGSPLLLMNGDSICRLDFSAFWAAHRRYRADITQVVWRTEDASRYGTVVVNDDNTVQQFSEKEAAPRAAWVNAGVYLIERPLAESIPADLCVSLEREMFPLWARRHRFCAFRAADVSLDIGTPESFAAAQADLHILHR
jgi:NDP-sugar pyrophosphorylase family protein